MIEEINSYPKGKEQIHVNHEYLHVIYGPMFAGKTTKLNRILYEKQNEGKKTLKIIHDIDKLRISTNKNGYSHNSNEITEELLLNNVKYFEFLNGETQIDDTIDVIGIDEGQFFKSKDDNIKSFVENQLKKGKEIHICSLSSDFTRAPFGNVLSLIDMADYSENLLAEKCQYCNKKGSFSMRLSKEDNIIVIGGGDKYVPVCREHHKVL